MLIDSQLEFSDAQAVTSTAISTNVVDLQIADQTNETLNLGIGTDMYLVVQTNTAATDSGSDATLTITLESADNAALSTNAVTHFSTGAIPFASFAAAGSKLVAVKLPEHIDYKRYLGLRYTVASGPLTAGAFDAMLVTGVQNSTNYYKSAFTV